MIWKELIETRRRQLSVSARIWESFAIQPYFDRKAYVCHCVGFGAITVASLINILSHRSIQILFIDSSGEEIRAVREKALLTVAYDTMARRAELVALDFDDITIVAGRDRAGTHSAIDDRSRRGRGNTGYLARGTVRLLGLTQHK
jgi:integrase